MNIETLSDAFAVRRLCEDDVERIYDVCRGNKIFYEYHPPFVTRDSIREDMAALPPGKGREDKYFVGFFARDALVAIMDLILDYPREGVAFIGLFMVNLNDQNRGVGSKIIGGCMDALRRAGFHTVRLGVDRGNPQSYAFWQKNGFRAVSEGQYIVMESALSGAPRWEGKEI